MKFTAHEFCRAIQSLKPQSSSSASNDGTVVDAQGFDEALVIANFGAATGAASTVMSVRESDNSDGSSSAAVASASFVAVTSANHNTEFVGRLSLAPRKRYLFTRAVGDGANVQLYSTTFVLLRKKYPPATQENALAFNIDDQGAL